MEAELSRRTTLDWQRERTRTTAAVTATATTTNVEPEFLHYGSNVCLDFHGDPARARLVVFSDGNHHMALQETLQAFLEKFPETDDVFYLTTPPRVAVEALTAGCIHIGNLRLALFPHVFISPPAVLARLAADGHMAAHAPFMQSRGNVLLVARGNPKGIFGIKDLLREDVRLFLSNPKTETISYQVYADTLRNLARSQGITLDFLEHPASADVSVDGATSQRVGQRVIYGESIHHREAPQFLAEGRADAAMVYYHLALCYQRIFPDRFEIVWLNEPFSTADQVISQFNCGLIGAGGVWGQKLIEFLMSDTVTGIYERHGLQRPR